MWILIGIAISVVCFVTVGAACMLSGRINKEQDVLNL